MNTREDYLRSLIKKQGPLKDFASQINMPYTTLLSILKNVGGASIDNILKICNGLGISPEELNNVDINFTIPKKNTIKDFKDLNQFLNNTEILFDGEEYKLDEEDRQKLRNALEFAFWEVKKRNKRKKN